MAFTFDGATRIITVDAGVFSFNAQDLYEEWKEWFLLSDNAKWPIALETIGGDSIGSGQVVSPYFFVVNSWVIKPDESDHTLTVTGNLFSNGGGSPFISTTGAYNVRIVVVVSSNSLTVDTGGGGSDPWATALPGSYSEGTAGKILGSKVLTLARFLGLK
jgi:hypothetical protein